MLERAQSNARKSFEASKKADRLDTRADAAEANTAISSDDPEALTRLKAELAAMEAKREAVKTKNRLARAGRLPDAENPENPAAIRSIAGARRYPMPGYVLRNLGANIRRVQQRIEQLSMREGRVARSCERGGVRVVENGGINRLQEPDLAQAQRVSVGALRGGLAAADRRRRVEPRDAVPRYVHREGRGHPVRTRRSTAAQAQTHRCGHRVLARGVRVARCGVPRQGL